MKHDRHSEVVARRARSSVAYRKTFARTLRQIDLALLVSEMREEAGLTQAALAKRVGTTQSVIARLEDAEYTGHSLVMLERIAAACGVALKLHAEKKAGLRPGSSACLTCPTRLTLFLPCPRPNSISISKARSIRRRWRN